MQLKFNSNCVTSFILVSQRITLLLFKCDRVNHIPQLEINLSTLLYYSFRLNHVYPD